MKHRILGRTGIEVSEIGMGTEHLLDKDAQIVADTIAAAINGGINYFDCHPGHDSQEDSIDYVGYQKLGKALQGARDKLTITYLAPALLSPTDTEPRFASYLRAMDTDHTDVFIIQFCDKVKDFEHVIGVEGFFAVNQNILNKAHTKHINIK